MAVTFTASPAAFIERLLTEPGAVSLERAWELVFMRGLMGQEAPKPDDVLLEPFFDVNGPLGPLDPRGQPTQDQLLAFVYLREWPADDAVRIVLPGAPKGGRGGSATSYTSTTVRGTPTLSYSGPGHSLLTALNFVLEVAPEERLARVALLEGLDSAHLSAAHDGSRVVPDAGPCAMVPYALNVSHNTCQALSRLTGIPVCCAPALHAEPGGGCRFRPLPAGWFPAKRPRLVPARVPRTFEPALEVINLVDE